jgi:WD40 repeat protein
VVALWDGTGAFVGDSTLRALAVSADGRRAVAAGPGLVAVFDLDDVAAGPIAATVVEGHEAFAVALTPGERYFVTAGAEGTLRVFDAETAAAVGQLERAGLAGLASDAVSGQLVSGGADGKIRLFGCTP